MTEETKEEHQTIAAALNSVSIVITNPEPEEAEAIEEGID
jgi:hypothetical protein